MYPPSLCSSTTLHPGAEAKHFLIFSRSILLLNSILTDSEWPTKTGTLTQVAVKFILGSKIFFVSTTIFHSSFVEPSFIKLSICGITLKAICLVKFLDLTFLFSKIDFVWSSNSIIWFLPPPETD